LATSAVVNGNHSLLHVNTTIGTPKSNKRKLGGCTPAVTPSANKLIKREFGVVAGRASTSAGLGRCRT
jgi:hypothetical protein